MNPQKTIQLFIIILLSAVALTACKKDEPVEVPTDSSPVQQLSQDDSSVEYNVDEVLIDAGKVLSGKDGLKNMGLPCNATLDTMFVINDTINYQVSYHGLNCMNTKYRTGIIIVKIKQNTQWFLPGSFLVVEFYDYTVTQVSNGKTMKINGMASLENISGGIIELLGTGISTVIHRNTAHMLIVFNNHPPRDWHLTKLLVFTGQPGSLVLAVNGFGAAQGYNKLLSWGKDRDGKNFFIQVEESVVFTEFCNFRPHSGQQVYSIPENNLKATAIFGFNDNNQAVSGSECPTRYRLDWQQHGHSGTIFLPLAGNY
ncbi:MAG: hypothetical protein ABFS05_01980 [Bacteroidota bacterium]